MYNTQPYNQSLRDSVNNMSGAYHQQQLINLESVSVRFDKKRALHNLNFNLKRKEIVFLTGVSGAGKTTLLNVLAGRIAPDAGRVERSYDDSFFMSSVFQNLYLDDRRSVESNLYTSYDQAIYRSENDFVNDLNDFAKIIGIYDRLHLKVKNANGGLKQKTAFLRAMLSKPDLLLADEPTASLDFDNAKKMFDILNIYNVKQGLTVVWASHNKDLVKRFSGRIAHLDSGKLIHSGHACFI